MMQIFKNFNLSKKNLLVSIILGIILIVALFIRIYDLSSIPSGFHIDEASLGYNGYSLLLTGKDDNGDRFPLYVDMFGDNRPSGYHYLTILPIKAFGLNEFATRLPVAFFGGLTVISFFFLTLVLFKSKKISLISAFLIAIAPWSVALSRASNETVVALFFIISGYVLFLVGFEKKQAKYFFLSSLVLLPSFFLYHTPRVFVPMLVFTSILYLFPIWRKFEIKRKFLLLLAFIILALVSFSLVFLIKGGTGRFSQVNIFSFPETKLVMEEQIREDGTLGAPVVITRLFHNKLTNYSLGIISNYSDYFTGKFLFIEGGLPVWYKVPGMGLIYIVEFPFILLGIFYLFFSKDKKYKLPLLWLIVAPITAAITIDDVPNVNRAIVMFPMLELLAAYGFVIFSNKLSHMRYKLLIGGIGLLLILNSLYFLHQYFIQAPIHRNWYRNEGFGEMVATVKKDYANYDKIIVTKSEGGIYPLILFYMKYDPAIYQREGSPKDKAYGGFGKFFFAEAACPSLNRDQRFPNVKKIIYVDNGTCPDYPSLNLVHYVNIYRKDGTRVFRIVYE